MPVQLRKKEQSKEPFWLTPGPIMSFFEVKIKVKPQDSALQLLMQEGAKAEFLEITEAIKKLKTIGAKIEDMPDLDDDQQRDAYVKLLAAKHAARHAIIEWEGVLDPDDASKTAEINQTTIDDFINLPNMAAEFTTQYNLSVVVLKIEQNFSTPAPIGTSEAGENIAPNASEATSLVPVVNEESTENVAHT